MKAILPDGKVMTGTFPAMSTGYVAKTIEIDSRDVRAMITLLESNPKALLAHLMQLRGRFENERIGSAVTDMHPCPYQSEINDNNEPFCRCGPEEVQQCKDEI